jgi:hypothetical protein
MLCCKTSLESALLGVAFGHHNIQTLHRETSFSGDFSKKKVHLNNPRSLEEFKYNKPTEQTFGNTDPETLRTIT